MRFPRVVERQHDSHVSVQVRARAHGGEGGGVKEPHYVVVCWYCGAKSTVPKDKEPEIGICFGCRRFVYYRDGQLVSDPIDFEKRD